MQTNDTKLEYDTSGRLAVITSVFYEHPMRIVTSYLEYDALGNLERVMSHEYLRMEPELYILPGIF